MSKVLRLVVTIITFPLMAGAALLAFFGLRKKPMVEDYDFDAKLPDDTSDEELWELFGHLADDIEDESEIEGFVNCEIQLTDEQRDRLYRMLAAAINEPED